MTPTIEAPFDPANVRLLGNRVLLQQLPAETRSPGGIHLLPQPANGDRSQWRVVRVGPGRKTKCGLLVPPEVSPGDKVLCMMHCDFIHLDNSMRVIDAKWLEMKWDYAAV